MYIRKLKVILIVGLLIALLPGIPYGYFSILRIYAIIVFGILALQIPKTKQNTKNKNFLIYLFLIILFQPILKIPLGRTIWNIIDIAVAIWLLITLNRKK